jgi:hypothetical protein
LADCQAPTDLGKARRTVFTVLGHLIARAQSVAALFMLALGNALLAAGWVWN